MLKLQFSSGYYLVYKGWTKKQRCGPSKASILAGKGNSVQTAEMTDCGEGSKPGNGHQVNGRGRTEELCHGEAFVRLTVWRQACQSAAWERGRGQIAETQKGQTGGSSEERKPVCLGTVTWCWKLGRWSCRCLISKHGFFFFLVFWDRFSL